MGGKLGQYTHGFWFQKLQEQFKIINEKKKKEPLERAYCLDIALAYLFLYLFIESTVDQIAIQLYHCTDFSGTKKYKKEAKYLRDKLDFIFADYCQDLRFKDLVDVKQKIKPLIQIRNKIVHIEEISWQVSDFLGDRPPKETPKGMSRFLTVKKISESYKASIDFFQKLKIVLDKGLGSKMINVTHSEGDRREIRKRNLIDYIYEISVPNFSNFEMINND